MKRIFLLSLFVACQLVVAFQTATAQDVGSSVTGSGVSSVVCVPKIYRMTLPLSAKGKTLEEALAALKTQREKAAKQLEGMGVDSKSIVVSTPMQTADASEQKKLLESGLMEKFKRAGRDPKTMNLPTNYAAAASLTAKWTLKAGTPEELLIQMQQIKTKVEAAKLTGAGETKPLTPEEQELAEEMSSMNRSSYSMMGNDGERGQTGPSFVVVVSLTEAEREKAQAQAFAKAKAEAASLAKAAGATLGELRSIDAFAGASSANYEQAMMMRRYRQQAYGGGGGGDEEESGADEGATVTQPMAEVTIRVQVHATFKLNALH